jgi:hypothetical protein
MKGVLDIFVHVSAACVMASTRSTTNVHKRGNELNMMHAMARVSDKTQNGHKSN